VKFVLVIFSLVSAFDSGSGYKVDYFLLVFKLQFDVLVDFHLPKTTELVQVKLFFIVTVLSGGLVPKQFTPVANHLQFCHFFIPLFPLTFGAPIWPGHSGVSARVGDLMKLD